MAESDLNAASTRIRSALRECGEIVHFSIWGNDVKQRRAFLAHEILAEVGTKDLQLFTTARYGEGVVGRAAQNRVDTIVDRSNFTSAIENTKTAELLISHGVSFIACFCVPSPPEFPGCVAVAIRKPALSLTDIIRNVKLLAAAFFNAYGRIRTRRFEKLVERISHAKMQQPTTEFLQTAGDEIALAFDATTFSIWSIEDNRVVPKYFSESHRGDTYALGEGLTGSAAKSGKPIFLHVLSDSKALYDIAWVGKVSDYGQSPAQEGDHIMVLPLVYPKRIETPPSVNGVIRFIAQADCASFWPIDFERAQTVAKTLSVLLYQEAILAQESINNLVLKNLLALVYRTRAEESKSRIAEVFLKVICNWPEVLNAAILLPERNGNYDLTGFSWIAHSISADDRADLRDFNRTLRPSDDVRLWPIRDEERQHAILAVRLSESDEFSSEDWIQLAGLILGSLFSIRTLVDETGKLRRDIEQKEMAALAGAVSRIYAHEVRNGCKAIKAWIAQAQKKAPGPDYRALDTRLQSMQANIDELLNSTGFLKLRKRDCVLNTEIQRVLETCGYRHGGKFEGCEIRWDIAGHKHHPVHIDPNTLLGILQNLILNAVEQYQARRKTGPIEIGMFDEEVAESKFVGFSVTDYAGGIPDENLAAIWKYGFTTKEGDGKGLGLCIVKRLVEECDGHVSVETRFGSYASFRVRYPLTEERGET